MRPRHRVTHSSDNPAASAQILFPLGVRSVSQTELKLRPGCWPPEKTGFEGIARCGIQGEAATGELEAPAEELRIRTRAAHAMAEAWIVVASAPHVAQE
jgi:hypothetical protein